MKKVIKKFSLLLFSFYLLSGCSVLNTSDNGADRSDLASKHIDTFLNVLRKRNQTSLLCLFSKKAVGWIKDFSYDVAEFFQFFQGDIFSYTIADSSPCQTLSQGKKDCLLYYVFQFYINTTVANYHIAYYESLIDIYQEENEGIWSLNIWQFDENVPPKRNWYDDDWEDGIHIFKEMDE